MSYTALIYRDSPECIWSLEETSGTQVLQDPYLKGVTYNGVSPIGEATTNASRSLVPIVYGGKASICNTTSASSGSILFTVPCLDKFTSKSKYKSYSLEFWTTIDFDASLLSSGATSRIKDIKIMGLTSSNTGLYLRDFDYLVFKIGDTGQKLYESAVHIPRLHDPLHIVVVYKENSMQLFVNGIGGNVAKIDSTPFGTYSSKNLEFYYPASDITGIKYDSVALYNVYLNSASIKRHYVYGLGFNRQKYFLKSSGAYQYKTNLQTTTPIRTINYNDSSSWSSAVKFNNLLLTDNGLYTQYYPKPSIYYYKTTSTDLSQDSMYTADGFIFPQDAFSYLQIENYEDITDGATKKFEAKFKIPATGHGTNEQQLFHISSYSNPETYLSFTITGSIVKGYYKTKSVAKTQIGTDFNLNGATEFFISMAYDALSLKYAIVPKTGTAAIGTVNNVFDLFPIGNGYIRFGSAPVFFGNRNQVAYTPNSTEVKNFDGTLIQVDISNSTTATTTWASYPTQKISNLYQLYFDGNTKRTKIATAGTFTKYLSLLDLIGTENTLTEATNVGVQVDNIELAAKTEIGSQCAEITYSTKNAGNSNAEIGSGDIRNLSLPTSSVSCLTENTQFVITGTLRSSDAELTPGVLKYLNITSYPVKSDSSGKYIEIEADNQNANIRYYSGTTRFKFLPELEETTDIHRASNSGIQVGTNKSVSTFLQIPLDSTVSSLRSVDSASADRIYSISFLARFNNGLHATAANNKLVKIGSVDITWANIASGGATYSTYLNGSTTAITSTTGINPNTWNHYTIKFSSGLTMANILFGSGSSSLISIDDIIVGTKNSTATELAKIYTTAFSNPSTKVYAGGSGERLILINDTEFTDGQTKYQKIINESSIVPYTVFPKAASTQNITEFGGTKSASITSFLVPWSYDRGYSSGTYPRNIRYYLSGTHYFNKDDIVNISLSGNTAITTAYNGTKTIASVGPTYIDINDQTPAGNLIYNPTPTSIDGWTKIPGNGISSYTSNYLSFSYTPVLSTDTWLNGFYSADFPVTAGANYTFSLSGYSTSTYPVSYAIEYKTTMSGTYTKLTVLTFTGGTTWTRRIGTQVTMPSGATHARVTVYQNKLSGTAIGTTGTTYIKEFLVERATTGTFYTNAVTGSISSSIYYLNRTSNGQEVTIDSQSLNIGDIILLKNQTTLANNGIYTITGKAQDDPNIINHIAMSKNATYPENNNLVYVKTGPINGTKYFTKNSDNSYSSAITQEKIVSYQSNNPDIEVYIEPQ